MNKQFDAKYLDMLYFFSTSMDFNMELLPESIIQEIPTELIRIELDAYKQYLSAIEAREPASLLSDEQHAHIEKLIQNWGGRVFCKLSGRSPKDSDYFFMRNRGDKEGAGLAMFSSKEIESAFLQSERISDDLYRCASKGVDAYLVVRKFIDMQESQEFRCFRVDGELMGISQYFYKGFYPEIVENEKKIIELINAKHSALDELLPKTCIFDLLLPDFAEAKVIEVNPFGCMTDPCMYRVNEGVNGWSVDMFDEAFKFNKKDPSKDIRRSAVKCAVVKMRKK